jgi:glutamyl-tRNA synthetase
MGAVFLKNYYNIPGEALDKTKLKKIVEMLGERFKTLRDLADQSYYFFTDDVSYDQKAVRKFLHKTGTDDVLEAVGRVLSALPSFDEAAIEGAIRSIIEARNMKPGQVMQPVRVALTGRTASPGMFETIAALGSEKTLARLQRAVTMIRERDNR